MVSAKPGRWAKRNRAYYSIDRADAIATNFPEGEKLLPLFQPRAAIDAKRWRMRTSASPCLFHETFVARLYGLRTIGL